MTAAVNLVRPLALGRWPTNAMSDMLLLALWGIACYSLALGLTRKRLLK
jgi:lipooligosaccharide transport system permease protein